MVAFHLMSLETLRNEIETSRGTVASGGRPQILSDQWIRTISQEMSDVFSDLADRGLIEWAAPGQIEYPAQAEPEPARETAKNLTPIDQDALDAAIASMEPTTAAAEPVITNCGALMPPLPPFGSCEE